MELLGFEDYRSQARSLAEELGVEYNEVFVHRFPDEESFVRLPDKLDEHVVFCRSLNQPNDKLIELILAAECARQHGAKRLTLVAPYLCYMRQDIENHPGEAVSQRIIGKMLADYFDDIITVDPHLHRISTLQEAIPLENAISLCAQAPMADFLKQQPDNGMLFGPDGESEQWVADLAERIGFEYAIARKVRHGDKVVDIEIPDRDYGQRNIYIVDDIISTGHTVAKAAELLLDRGAKLIDAVVTHALFSPGAEQLLADAGIRRLWSSDSITHPTNRIALAGLLADAVRKLG